MKEMKASKMRDGVCVCVERVECAVCVEYAGCVWRLCRLCGVCWRMWCDSTYVCVEY